MPVSIPSHDEGVPVDLESCIVNESMPDEMDESWSCTHCGSSVRGNTSQIVTKVGTYFIVYIKRWVAGSLHEDVGKDDAMVTYPRLLSMSALSAECVHIPDMALVAVGIHRDGHYTNLHVTPRDGTVVMTDDDHPVFDAESHQTSDACILVYQRVDEDGSVIGPSAPPPRGLHRPTGVPSCFLNCALQLASQCEELSLALCRTVAANPASVLAPVGGGRTIHFTFPDLGRVPLPSGEQYANCFALLFRREVTAANLGRWGAVSDTIHGMAAALVRVMQVLQVRSEYEAVILTAEQVLCDARFVSGMFQTVTGSNVTYNVMRRDDAGTMWVISPDSAVCRELQGDDVYNIGQCVCLRRPVSARVSLRQSTTMGRGTRVQPPPQPPRARPRATSMGDTVMSLDGEDAQNLCWPRKRIAVAPCVPLRHVHLRHDGQRHQITQCWFLRVLCHHANDQEQRRWRTPVQRMIVYSFRQIVMMAAKTSLLLRGHVQLPLADRLARYHQSQQRRSVGGNVGGQAVHCKAFLALIMTVG